MRLPRETCQIQQTIETHLPHLSQPQLTGLVLWVGGAILAGSACQNAVASALSPWGSWNNLRQYLREWLYDGSDRTSPCQTRLDATLCFAPLLRWGLAWWRSGRLAPVSSTGQALAIDPTLKGDQTTAIVISVLYRTPPFRWIRAYSRDLGLIGVGIDCTSGRTLSAKSLRLFSALSLGIPP